MSGTRTAAASSSCRRRTWLERLGRHASMLTTGLPLRGCLKAGFQRLLQWQSSGRGLACKLPEGETIRILPQYRHVSWNMDEYHAFRKAVRPGAVALDVGANLGCYSLLLAQWVGPQGRVFAFEPAPETFAGLQQHIELNEQTDNLSAVHAAVSDQCGTVGFVAAGVHGDNHLKCANSDDHEHLVQVPAVTIDEFCAREKIQPEFIKVDVEGFEAAVLRGAERTIRAGGKNLSLFVEMHPSTWPRLGLSQHDIMDVLDRLGLRAIPLMAADDPWLVEGCCMQLVQSCPL